MFSRKSFTSAFICWNVLLSHVYLSLIYKNDLCLLFQLNFDIKKPTVLFFTKFEQQLLLNLKIQQGSFKINAQNQHDSQVVYREQQTENSKRQTWKCGLRSALNFNLTVSNNFMGWEAYYARFWSLKGEWELICDSSSIPKVPILWNTQQF